MSDLLAMLPWLSFALLVVLGLPTAWQMGRGHREVGDWQAGYDAGYRIGHANGIVQGERVGFADGKRTGEMMVRGDWVRHGVSELAQMARKN